MPDRHDYVALEWLRGEIGETLNQARLALETWVAHPGDDTSIEQCLEYVRRVHGSLQMIEFYGAALFAEEIEETVVALRERRVAQHAEAERLLAEALLQLPVYLERIVAARRDLPLVVLPLLNDLRSVRGESMLSETSLFSPQLPDIEPLSAEALASRETAEVPGLLRKLRQTLQNSLACLLREQEVDTQLRHMVKVFARLEELCRDAPLAPLWQVASALVTSIADGYYANSPALRTLLREADRELRRLLEQGLAGINQPAPEELLKSLLFYIAKSTDPSPRTAELRERYALAEALPEAAVVDEERARLAGPDRDAMRSVITAVCEELVRTKERLDQFVRGSRQQVADLERLLPPLRQIADTLAVLGFGQPRRVIIDQLTAVQALASGEQPPSDASLMDVAGALLYVEATLSGMAGPVEPASPEENRLPTTDLSQIHRLVVRESITVLGEVAELIEESLGGEWHGERVEPVSPLLAQVRGALAMIPLARAAGLVGACDRYVLEQLQAAPQRPPRERMERLAEAVAGIGYYLERLAQDLLASGEQPLDLAERSLLALGYAPETEVQVPLLDEVVSQEELLSLQEGGPSAATLAEVLARPLSSVNPPARHIPTSLLPPPKDEASVDEELRDVFLEETAEVLADLHRYLPQWLSSLESHPPLGDSAPLAEIRRAFHTLKGSGRMVRALVVAELAWALENVLNRVLEGDVAADEAVRSLLQDTLTLLPDVVRDFAEDVQHQRDDVDELAALAHALARGAEVAPTPAVETPVVERDDAIFDPQLLDIFRQEALGHLQTLHRYLTTAQDLGQTFFSDDLQRALHTLKGSAYMAGVLPIAELASPLDHLVREYKANRLSVDEADLDLLQSGERLFHLGLAQLDVDPLGHIPGASRLVEALHAHLDERLAAMLDGAGNRIRPKRNPELIASFLAEGMDILLDAESLLQRWRQHPGERQELSQLLDELTTLGHGSHHADLPQVDELCEALLDLYGAVEEGSLPISQKFFDEAERAHEDLIDMLDQIAAGQEAGPRPERVLALRRMVESGLAPGASGVIHADGSMTSLEAASSSQAIDDTDGLDQEIVDIFLEEAVDILDSAGDALQRWLDAPDNPIPLTALQRDLHTLKGGARMAEITPIGDLGHELEALYEGLIDRRCAYTPALADLLVGCHDRLAAMLDQLRARQTLTSPSALIDALREYRLGQNVPPAVVDAAADMPTSFIVDERDPELLEIFLEEGFDIIESTSIALARWQADPQNLQEVDNLMRDLHTLKGGARMVEVTSIGDLAHEMESLYEGLSKGVLKNSALLAGLLQSGHDMLADMLDAVREEKPLPDPGLLIDSIRRYSTAGHIDVPPPAPLVEDDPAPEPPPPLPEADAERSGAEMVKVPAEQLETLVNLAGETSIFRGRLEQQVSDVQAALSEIDTTLERMRDQLRRLDIETQGRISSRDLLPGERLGYEEFDPLEMDRHSQLQQLSRALFESASDLTDLKETLDKRAHQAQLLLAKQARVNTELQESLVRTRMVPFERMVPRLRRVVRQVAGELNKKVRFEVINAEGEMDRNVLERMVAPLEHMLRNAVDHGLESSEKRVAAGKPEIGHIVLELSHEGADIVIDMRDDGAGIDLEAVRRKAVKRGLISEGAVPSEHDVLQFILQAGFSTASTITQISGRGVGMDVVHAEVKELGGSMGIDSRPGEGARFRIRLPFTVSVGRAQLVMCGEEQYAVPLNGIEGVVRVMPAALEACYQSTPPLYRYGERTYELRYLGDLLGTGQVPALHGHMQPLPVLLVHAPDQWVAVQVDALAGAREIVVKSLGQQFAGVQGISGATILGDGGVVLILDLFAQVRRLQSRVQARTPEGLRLPAPLETEHGRRLLVLVVDDSITVRKVTSRLLERHGMRVLTAKDGVDAMALLREHSPDVMLLDIEMPRMDGFEVASAVRADRHLQHLPIIMITSRSGQKHRDRAMALGVNEYLSKPYQESVLLDSIAHWSQQHV